MFYNQNFVCRLDNLEDLTLPSLLLAMPYLRSQDPLALEVGIIVFPFWKGSCCFLWAEGDNQIECDPMSDFC